MTWLVLLLLSWLWAGSPLAQMWPNPGPGRAASGGGGGGAPVRTGTPAQTVLGNPNTGTTTLTVPSDATMAVCGVTGYLGTANVFTGAAGSLKLNSVNFTNITGGDSDTGLFMGGMFYLANPATGSPTLAWDWGGTAALTNGALLLCSYYKGVNASTPVRSTSCIQAGSNATRATATLTAQTNDLIVAIAWAFGSQENTFAFTGATVVTQAAWSSTHNGDQALAEASPTGNQAVSAASSPEDNDGGICALVLAP